MKEVSIAKQENREDKKEPKNIIYDLIKL